MNYRHQALISITDLISFAIAKVYIIKIFKIEKKNCHSAFFCSKLNIFLSVVLFHHWGRRLYSVYAANKKCAYLEGERKIV